MRYSFLYHANRIQLKRYLKKHIHKDENEKPV